MQKSFVVVATFLLLSVFTSSLASAAFSDAVTSFGESVWDVVEPLAVFLLGSSSDGGLFMGRLLVFVILFSLVWIAVRQFPGLGENKLWVWVIAFAFSILAVRFTGETWIETIILPYSVFGIAMTAFFPLVVYFFFVEGGLQASRTLRKIAWIFAAAVFVGMFIYRYEDLNGSFVGTIGPAWIYLGAAVASVAFLFADRTIQTWWRKEQSQHLTDVRESKARSIVMKQRMDLEQGLLDGSVTKADYKIQDQELKEKEKRYKII